MNTPIQWLDRVRLLGCDRLQQVQLIDGRVSAIGETILPPDAADVIDVQGDYLSLGGVDLQINGALGIPFPNLTTSEPLRRISAYLWQQGIDAYAPTIVTAPLADIQRALAAIEQFQPEPSHLSAAVLGAHLEGPCLNPAKRGAHPAAYLQPLTREVLEQMLGAFSSTVAMITLAPELDASGTALPYLHSLGIRISLGHSLATAAEADAAFAAGATMVTHAFNAMPPLHHREPGLLAAALVNPQVWCGVIGDGVHVHPLMLKLLYECAGDRLFLVSDALAPLGLGDGVYPWDSRQIHVQDGTARLADGTLCGTTVPLLAMVGRLVDWGVCDFARALQLATVNPRRALGLGADVLGQPITNLLRWRSPHQYERLLPAIEVDVARPATPVG